MKIYFALIIVFSLLTFTFYMRTWPDQDDWTPERLWQTALEQYRVFALKQDNKFSFGDLKYTADNEFLGIMEYITLKRAPVLQDKQIQCTWISGIHASLHNQTVTCLSCVLSRPLFIEHLQRLNQSSVGLLFAKIKLIISFHDAQIGNIVLRKEIL
jgi:hypothetical protein